MYSGVINTMETWRNDIRTETGYEGTMPTRQIKLKRKKCELLHYEARPVAIHVDPTDGFSMGKTGAINR
jgi:hypothetical protein